MRVLTVLSLFFACAASAGPFDRRLVQILYDYTDDAHVGQTAQILSVAKAHGYTGVVFASSVGLGDIHRWDAKRLGRFMSAKRLCDEAGLEIGVGVWSIGYAKESFFTVDPNLAAASPVFGTVYRLTGGRCVHVPNPPRELLAEPCEIHSPRQEGDVATLRVSVKPQRSYRLRITASSDASARPEWPIAANVRRIGAKTDYIEYRVFKVKTDGSKQTFELFFPSLDESEITVECRGYNRIYPGVVRIRSLELAETEPQLVLRRSGTPVTVRHAKTGKTFVEGVDYAEIPRAKHVWPGPWVKEKFAIVPIKGGAMSDGDELVVDCYCSFPVWGKWVSACMAAPELDPILEQSAAKIAELVNPRLWVLSFDEVRAGGGCQDCRKLGDMAHAYAALCTKCMSIVRKHRPDAEIYVWNDLVDPHSLQDDGKNAQMYSSMKGVWDLLPSDLGIGYWTYRWREEGMRYFSERGRRQLVCAYYDEKELKRSLEWMDLAQRTPGVAGIIYCTWGDNWDLLGAFGDKVLEKADEGRRDDGIALQRRIDASPGGVVRIASGVQTLVRPLVVTNGCSLELDKNAILRAMRPMENVVEISFPRGDRDHGTFFRGGIIDGNGQASGMKIHGFSHCTLSDMQFWNGRVYGLQVGKPRFGCELMANNLYIRSFRKGLAGNTGLRAWCSDCHFTDVVVVDCTIGIDVQDCGASRFTRCHVWGGPIREMLENSVNFRVGPKASGNIFRDCYADTGKVGFWNEGWENRYLGCSYFNNKGTYGLEDVLIVKQPGGTMLFADGFFHKSCDKIRIYEGNGRIAWKDMQYSHFGDGRELPGKCAYDPTGAPQIELGR